MSTLSRRGLLASLLAAGGGACASPNKAGQPFFQRAGLPIGLQLYTLAELAGQDLDGTLRAVARIGYRDIELAGFLGRTGAQLRTAFNAAGLTCSAAHVQARAPTGLSLSSDTGTLAAELHAVGVDTAVMPIFIVPERLGGAQAGERFPDYIGRVGPQLTADDWRYQADFLNERGAALKKEGLRLAYHNHNCEFAPSGGSTGWDILLTQTDPALVAFEMDVGWLVAAGRSPLKELEAHPDRFTQMHVKDIKASTVTNFNFKQDPCEVGEGIIDWPKLLPAAYAAGVRRFFVEQEPPFARPRLEAVRRSFDYLSKVS